MEGNLRFEIDWASLIVGIKITVFALFYSVFELRAIFKYKPPPGGGAGSVYLEGRSNRGFFAA